MKQQLGCYLEEDGASGRIRTSDRSVRSRVLYPAELRMHQGTALLLFQCRSTCRNTAQYGASRRITWLRLALRAVAKATLSSLVLAITSQTMKQQFSCYLEENGASRRIRTSDRSVRSRVLYPAELWMQMAVRRGFEPRMQLLTAYSLSRGAPSASRPPHQHASCECFEELVSALRRCVGAHITFWDL